MQAVESETVILYHTELRGQWPDAAAHELARRLPYVRRLATSRRTAEAHASLAGIALALRALARLLGRGVAARELVFARGEKPRLASGPPRSGRASHTRGARACEQHGAAPGQHPDFSIAHAGPWVACAALLRGRVGLDVEIGTEARIADWVVREAALKASGEGLRAAREVRELEWDAKHARWRGERWHLWRGDLFPGASACVVSSLAPPAVEARAIALAELFAP